MPRFDNVAWNQLRRLYRTIEAIEAYSKRPELTEPEQAAVEEEARELRDEKRRLRSYLQWRTNGHMSI